VGVYVLRLLLGHPRPRSREEARGGAGAADGERRRGVPTGEERADGMPAAAAVAPAPCAQRSPARELTFGEVIRPHGPRSGPFPFGGAPVASAPAVGGYSRWQLD